MSPKHQVRHFSDILPNLIVALDGFLGYNRIIESNYEEDAYTEPNGGPMENSRTPATCGILNGQTVQPKGVDSVPIDAFASRDTALTDFKVVGYYPSWELDKLQFVGFGVVTHVCYAFAIPTAEGGLRDLENLEAAETLIRSAIAWIPSRKRLGTPGNIWADL